MRYRACIIAILALLAGPAAAAETLVADLSEHRIRITTGFTGTDVVLFGAVESEGDVVVVVRGPEQTTEVWRKGRYAGIWLNDKKVVFERVPSFYAVASNRLLREIADDAVLDRHQIGPGRLNFEAGRIHFELRRLVAANLLEFVVQRRRVIDIGRAAREFADVLKHLEARTQPTVTRFVAAKALKKDLVGMYGDDRIQHVPGVVVSAVQVVEIALSSLVEGS